MTLFLSAALSLFITEICFRFAGVRGVFHRPRIDRAIPIVGMPVEDRPYGFYSHTRIVSHYDSNPRGYFDSNFAIVHEHNSEGWRDVEYSLTKPPNVFRILGLGDSYLWGQGVKREDICLTRLPDHLGHAMPDRKIETINTAISGLNTTNQRDQLAARGLAYDPDLVILHYVLNDVESDLSQDGPKIEFLTDYFNNAHQSSDLLSQYSNAWSWARQRIVNHIRAERFVRQSARRFHVNSAGWLASKEALCDIQRLCKDRGIRFCVVVFPFFHHLDGDYPFQQIHDVVREFCRSRGIMVLDLRNEYRQFHGPELWVHPTDQHPNEIAHDIAARAIARFVMEHSETLLGRN